jgi:protein involved in polysaccharide export with SLBB domain
MQDQSTRALHTALLASVCLLLATASVGCAPKDALKPADVAEMNTPRVEPYVLGVGDVIAVKFLYYSELNEELTIRTDGMITLQYLGDVMAAGRTPSELDSLLTERYSDFLEPAGRSAEARSDEQLEIAVIVRSIASQKVYVGGEVARPSMVPIRDSLGLLDAVIEAGGLLNTAESEALTLIRSNPSGEPYVYTVNLEEIANGRMPDVTLRAFDVVYVHKSGIAQVGQFADQYIYSLIPASFLVTYRINPDVQIK